MKSRKTMLCLAAGVIMLCILSGCGKKAEPEKEATEVIRISITPEATPTPEPEQVNQDAVVTNGNITMVNEYLMSEPENSK